MHPPAAALPEAPAPARPLGFAIAAALALVAPLAACAPFSSLPLPLLAGAALFLFLAVAHDVHRHRIPNRVTFAAFAAALAWGASSGGVDGLVDAALGAVAALALLALPYELGAIGAGDVKAAMALGAGLGAGAVAPLALLALALGGGLAALRVALRATSERPAGSVPGGLPFAIALALALGAQQLAHTLASA